MERVVCVPQAKVPIVKLWDPELLLACDLNVNNTLALENTRMIKTYVEIDERVRPLAMIIKHWTRRRIINDAGMCLFTGPAKLDPELKEDVAFGGTLSSYTWICMIINFLQTRNPPVLPSLHKRPHQRRVDSEGKLSAFADDLETLRGFGKNNPETIGELLFHFFRRYAHEIDYDRSVVSIREGQLISKQAKRWHLMQNNRLCVEEPFNTDRNLGNTVDDISFRGVHLELRRAFELVSELKLEEACEQYVFPPTAQTFWAKPPAQPRPVLSRSLSQSRAGRGGNGGGANNTGRGGRQQQNQHRTGPSNRRASSAAALNKLGVQGASNAPQNGIRIHDQLYHQYQALHAREVQLRAHLHQRAQAQLHAEATAQVHPVNALGSPYTRLGNTDGLRRHTTNDPAPLSAPMRNMAFFYPSPYTGQPLNMTNVTSRQNVRTNPPSPSMSSIQPVQAELRRGVHRSSALNSPVTSLRSHSQPASNMRSSPQPMRDVRQYLPMVMSPMFQGATLSPMQRQIDMQQQSAQAQQVAHQISIQAQIDKHQLNAQAQGSPRYASPTMDLPPGDTVPKYIGYYVHDTPPYQRNTPIAPIPSYHDLIQRQRSMAPDATRLGTVSRSPSPSSSLSGEGSSAFHSAASCFSTTSTLRSSSLSGTPSRPRRSGPIIASSDAAFPVPANGSSEASSSDYRIPSESHFILVGGSDQASVSDESMNTPVTGSITPFHELHDSFLLDPPESTHASQHSTMLQFGEFPARSTIRARAASRPEQAPSIDVPTPKFSSAYPVVAGSQSNSIGKGHDGSLPGATLPDGGDDITRVDSSQSTAIEKLNATVTYMNLNPDMPLKPLPFLSPVREVRTPPPAASRKEDAKPTLTGEVTHGRSVSASGPSPLSLFLNGGQQQMELVAPQPNGQPVSDSTRSLQTPSSGWQQTGKKGKKNKSKSNGAINGETLSTLGDVLGVTERKGG